MGLGRHDRCDLFDVLAINLCTAEKSIISWEMVMSCMLEISITCICTVHRYEI